ncbi:hypothetical protein PIROE2DRAFT_18945 [Piromyces sp. E2]|nr:hypothetical protein PIROE2DRAFT_18945 [Piromyces sp. E2]|eukprot:OUM56453.1 hypothetical protein PIROE2DRAFT_18945 [Piromyces sp. E2]
MNNENILLFPEILPEFSLLTLRLSLLKKERTKSKLLIISFLISINDEHYKSQCSRL